MRVDAKAEVAQDLGADPVAQTDMLESNHVPLRRRAAPGLAAGPPAFIPALYSSTKALQPLCKRRRWRGGARPRLAAGMPLDILALIALDIALIGWRADAIGAA